MKFADTEAAYDFYNKYAFHVGFSVRKNKIRKNKVDIPTYRTFCCYKEGTCKKPSASKSPPKYQRLDERTNCKAHMKVNLCKNGAYKVNSFLAEHNHPLATPRKRNFLQGYEYAPKMADEFKHKMEEFLQNNNNEKTSNDVNEMPESFQRASTKKNVESVFKKAVGVKKRDDSRGRRRIKSILEKKHKKTTPEKHEKKGMIFQVMQLLMVLDGLILYPNNLKFIGQSDNAHDTTNNIATPSEDTDLNIFGAPMFMTNASIQVPINIFFRNISTYSH
jgi:FAR1 DNA-binding domain